MLFAITQLRDVNTLQPHHPASSTQSNGPAETPLDFGERLLRGVEEQLNPDAFPNGSPEFDIVVDDLGQDSWEVSVQGTYPAESAQAIALAKKAGGGKAKMATTVTLVRGQMRG